MGVRFRKFHSETLTSPNRNNNGKSKWAQEKGIVSLKNEIRVAITYVGVSELVARPSNLIYALTSWTHSPASSLQEYPAAQDIACRSALFLEAHPPSPQANELVAVMTRTNTLVDNAFIPNLLLSLLK